MCIYDAHAHTHIQIYMRMCELHLYISCIIYTYDDLYKPTNPEFRCYAYILPNYQQLSYQIRTKETGIIQCPLK